MKTNFNHVSGILATACFKGKLGFFYVALFFFWFLPEKQSVLEPVMMPPSVTSHSENRML